MHKDLLWKQYQQHIELYKFYLSIVIKMEVLHYAITGAIFSYYLTHKEIENMFMVLWLPLIMSFFLLLLFVYGANRNEISRQDVFKLRDQLGLEIAPELFVLSFVLYIFSVLSFAIAVFCAYVIFVD